MPQGMQELRQTYIFYHVHVGKFYFAVYPAKTFLQGLAAFHFGVFDYFIQVSTDTMKRIDKRSRKIFIEYYMIHYIHRMLAPGVRF